MATQSLGDVTPAGSRHLGRRSAVAVVACDDPDGDPLVVTGRADGSLVAVDVAGTGDDHVAESGGDATALHRRWTHDGGDGAVVALVPFAGGVLAGERGPDGEIRLHHRDDGSVRWRYRGADDVGAPAKDTRFWLPFVADLATAGDRAYAAIRRYERGPDGDRQFESVVVALDADGAVRWRYRADASPIAVAADGIDSDIDGDDPDDVGDDAAGFDGVAEDSPEDRIAVAYNRCPGGHRDGLVVLDAADGSVRRRWDPPGDGQRRVGDVALVPDGVVCASHADYRGYRLARTESVADGGAGIVGGDVEDTPAADVDFAVRWRVDLGRPVERDGETVYAYPNHVLAGDDRAAFVTGNTYPEDGRETAARHPREHTVVTVSDADVDWTAPVGGFAHGVAGADGTLVVPAAQHFRDRDGEHGLHRFDVAAGRVGTDPVAGAVTAAAVGPGHEGRVVAAVEEPVSYHDADRDLGDYRLHVLDG